MADETNVLDQIQEESLRNRLAREVELLRGSRQPSTNYSSFIQNDLSDARRRRRLCST